MIFGKLEDIRAQVILLPQLLLALDHVQHTDFDSIEDCRYKLLGTNHEVIVQTFTPERFLNKVVVEGHLRFIDFYYIINGSEVIGIMPSNDLVEKSEYNDHLDVWTCDVAREKLSLIKLNKGDAVFIFPEDAHAPQLIDVEPAMTRKVIVKIEI